MASIPLLQPQGIDKGFPGFHVLDHVDFDQGEVVVFDQWRRRRLGV